MGVLPFGNGLTIGELNDAEKPLFILIYKDSTVSLYIVRIVYRNKHSAMDVTRIPDD